MSRVAARRSFDSAAVHSRSRRRQEAGSDADSAASLILSDMSGVSGDVETLGHFANRFEAVLNNFADRMAPKVSGVHAAALFLPPDDVPPEGYKEPHEVDVIPSRYTGPPIRTESTSSLATSVEANLDFRLRRRH